jgi:voltage-gated potassium channel
MKSATERTGHGSDALSPWDLFMLGISVLVLVSLALEMLLPMEAETLRLLNRIDTVMCGFFLVDFGVRLVRAKDRLEYMKWGWLDLLSSIPWQEVFAWGRLYRVVRVVRAVRSVRHIVLVLQRRRAQSMFLGAFLVGLVLIEVSSFAIWHFEKGAPGANITDPQRAFWWALVTITTVGYGDVFPVTSGGRVVAAFLMFGGIGLFSSFAALLSSWLTSQEVEREEEDHLRLLRGELREMRGEITLLREELQRERAGRPRE